MRKILATAIACLGFLGTAHAADKGSPPPAGTVVEAPASRNWHGFYAEASGTMFNVEVAGLGSTVGMVGLGAGYDHRVSNHFVIGAFVRYDVALDDADARSLSLGARTGYLVNPHLMMYVPVAYTVDGTNIDIKDGIWSVGLGLETYLIGNSITLFAEGTRNFSLAGDARFLDEATTARAGIRFRF